ncbi:hypothetical protein SARC_09167 [Sphaeroforma arctica JP610]|uniref:Pentatricopeptide repeat-containing protein-mitochondrial domain-containing protein n=1 Tax=Sphaeroforma arctica JP610 TaxID=667725 RepID=A0A0L0FQV9_9EUKA|nr:hypothetical protein SARC_09167 [Sphaeroforma arctica JP610]KNC78398.1 hypothetical protein SARC_09167 [Sphaeroforma arctica JP610]|eukprot:XP_014152300.1 hypothetical protein SARC_09167 [Sphaeroforma arctica JP610]
MASARTSKYSHQIRRLHDGCEWDLIIATVDDMRAEGVALDTYTQWATILAYENLGRYKNILEIFDALKRKGFAPEELAYSAAISACGERGQWENAADLYTRMKRDNISGTPEAHITAIAAYEKGRMWKELIGVAEDIRNNTLVVSDTNTNNIVMSSALLRHFYKQALDVFKVMVSLGHSRDVRTYSIALEACQIGGIKNRAIEVFNMMGQEGIPRSAATYISVVRTFMKTEQFAEALEWLDSVEREVKDIPADVYVYAIALCGKYGQWNKAMGLRYELERVTAATVPQYRRVENDYNGARP